MKVNLLNFDNLAEVEQINCPERSSLMPDAVQSNDYSGAAIHAELKKNMFALFNSYKGEEIYTRTIIFACTEDLNFFYFITHGDSEKIKQIRDNNRVSLGIFSKRTPLDDSVDVCAVGRAGILEDFNHPHVQQGLHLLAEKSPMMQMLIDSGGMNGYCMIKTDISELTFRIYKDILANVPKTILRFPS